MILAESVRQGLEKLDKMREDRLGSNYGINIKKNQSEIIAAYTDD